MFGATISQTPLTTPVADRYFKNISGDAVGGDVSFVATLRALVAPRMSKEDRLHFRYCRAAYTATELETARPRTVIRSVYMADDAKGDLRVCSVDGQEDGNELLFNLIREHFEEVYPEYTRLGKVHDFYRNSFDVECFVDVEKKNTIVFIERTTIKRLHYLEVSVLAFLPWYFNPEDGVSDLEMDLLYSLKEKTKTKYEYCIAKIAEQYDFRSEVIRDILEGFETRTERIRAEQLEETIKQIDAKIDRLRSDMAQELYARNEKCIILHGLNLKIENTHEDSELMEYFMCNKTLVLQSGDDTFITFSVKDYVEYFDRDMAKTVVENYGSYVYPAGESTYHDISAYEMRRLMTELFVEESPRLRLRMCAQYKFRIGMYVEGIKRATYPWECVECMPNPHIEEYSCLGNYEVEINDCIREHDYVGAIEQCVASCKSLNFCDDPVMRSFMRYMYSDGTHNNKCIETPDGQVLTPAGAIAWLKEQDDADEAGRDEAQDAAEMPEEEREESTDEQANQDD